MKDKAALGRIICIYLKINILYYTSVIIYFLNITESTKVPEEVDFGPLE